MRQLNTNNYNFYHNTLRGEENRCTDDKRLFKRQELDAELRREVEQMRLEKLEELQEETK